MSHKQINPIILQGYFSFKYIIESLLNTNGPFYVIKFLLLYEKL